MDVDVTALEGYLVRCPCVTWHLAPLSPRGRRMPAGRFTSTKKMKKKKKKKIRYRKVLERDLMFAGTNACAERLCRHGFRRSELGTN